MDNNQPTQPIDISVIVPFYNEEESLPELLAWIDRVMKQNNFSHEVVMIDDGSTDQSWETVVELQKTYPAIKATRFRRNYGKSPALFIAFEQAQGNVVITMDADLQDSPEEIPELYKMIVEQKYDLVSGWKYNRHDPVGKTWPSKFFNATARAASGIKLHDFNCGLKAYRRKVIKSIEVYGEMHRFIPILAKQAGFKKIGEKIVNHQARKYGVSKFGWERMIKGYIDMLSVMFTTRFGRRPMYIFSTIGTIMFLIGAAISVGLIWQKIALQDAGQTYRAVTDQPLFYIALTTIIMGTQLFLAGFLGEMINRNSPIRNNYLIDEKI